MRNLLPLVLILMAVPAHAEICGRILSGTGTVELLPNGKHKNRFYKIGTVHAVHCDEAIYTGPDSSAVIELGKAKIALGPRSRIEVAKYSHAGPSTVTNILNVIYGRLRIWYEKRQNYPLKVRTPTAVTGVRGTDFYISHDVETHVSEEATLQGSVEVAHVDAEDKTVVVDAGSQISVSEKSPELESTPLTELKKEEIRSISQPVQEDKDFLSVEAVVHLGDPKTWPVNNQETPVDEGANNDTSKPATEKTEKKVPDMKWMVSIGPGAGELDNIENSDGGVDGATATVQYHKRRKKMSFIGAVSLVGLDSHEDSGNSGGSGSGSNNGENKLDALNLEAGARLWHNSWWSPFARAGLSLAHHRVQFPNPTASGMLKTERDFVAALGTLGVDAFFNPGFFESVGFYTSAQAQLFRSVIAGKHSEDSSVSSVGKLSGFMVSLQLGLSF